MLKYVDRRVKLEQMSYRVEGAQSGNSLGLKMVPGTSDRPKNSLGSPVTRSRVKIDERESSDDNIKGLHQAIRKWLHDNPDGKYGQKHPKQVLPKTDDDMVFPS